MGFGVFAWVKILALLLEMGIVLGKLLLSLSASFFIFKMEIIIVLTS